MMAQLSISLIVCNLPVVVTFFFRHFKQRNIDVAENVYDYSPRPRSGVPLENMQVASGVTESDPAKSTDLTATIPTQHSSYSRRHHQPA